MSPAWNTDLLSKFVPFLDKWTLITKNLDAGDSCSNHFAVLYGLPHNVEQQVSALSWLVLDGIPRRHPDPAKWYCGINRTSRDQLIPYLCYLGSSRAPNQALNKAYFKRLAWQHAKLGYLFTWNTRRNFQYPTLAEHLARSTPDVQWNYSWKLPDVCGPDIWAAYLRGAMHHMPATRVLWPLLNILDIYQALDVGWIYWQLLVQGRQVGPTWKPKALDHDKKNTAILAHHAATRYSTPISKVVWMLLKPVARKAAHSFYSEAEQPPLYIAIDALD